MRAYLSCRNGHPLLVPALEGLRALGCTVTQGVPGVGTPTDMTEADLLVLTGLRRWQNEQRRAYESRGVPWVAFDLPHIRGTSDVRLYTGSHAWLPVVDGLPSRRARLPVTVAEPGVTGVQPAPKPKKRGRPKKNAPPEVVAAAVSTEREGYVLIIGQMPHDSSHGMNDAELGQWAADAAELVRECCPSSEIVWRPHPKTGGQWNVSTKGYDRMSDSHVEGIQDALAGAKLVCCYSSTVGLEALIAGVPVVAWGASCYRDLCAKPDEIEWATHPGTAAVEALLERIAWTQWSLDEVATGEPFRFILEQMGVPCSVVA